nr:bifunctional (p)ppGpp synthetase/guanosine-3',5'-bis(diphosphate) 3'-pyrophosphohydrolase [Gemella sanguinis]
MASKYLPEEQIKIIKESYELAKDAHEGQFRKSGEPYILHPIQVAGILTELKLDYATICAGFLHDVVEDTKYTLEDIKERFGDDIAVIVDGVTKLDKVKFRSKKQSQAENHRKLFVSIAKDLRVIFVKLADRLHNMRTMKYMREEKQREIASETLEIYAPLAHRLGISSVKWELEDTSLRYLHPAQYFSIVGMMKQKRSAREESIKEACESITALLGENNIKAQVNGRPKHIYSIYKKMVKQNKTFDQIYDLLAVRVLVDSVADCYATLGLVNNLWVPIPGRIKDYIAMPKPNMYQSLHTTVIAPDGQTLEVQIRTYEMHEIAEKGIAAHWAYKEGKKVNKDNNFYEKLNWFQKIAENDETEATAESFMESLKVDLLSDKIYVFTPNSDIIELPKGSCIVDFAYAIHSEVGNKMIGATVNDKIEAFDYKLSTGEICDIRTSKNSTGPKRSWLDIARSSQTKSKIKAFFKKAAREENLIKGEILLKDEIKANNFDIDEVLTEENIEIALNRYKFATLEELYVSIGYGGISANKVFARLTEKIRKEKQTQEKLEKLVNAEEEKKIVTETGVYVKGVDNILVRLSKCCQPIPGDDIVGFITKGRGVTVHRSNCPNLSEEDKARLLDVEWVQSLNARRYSVTLQLHAFDRELLLQNILLTLSESRVEIKKLHSEAKSDKTSVTTIGIYVKNVSECDFMIKKLRQIPDVYSVERIVK